MVGDNQVVISRDPTTAIKIALAGKFEIKEELGRGGMSVVYKARQRNLDRIVALKALPPQYTHDAEFLQRFHREARAGARFTHPNIMTIYDEGVEGGVHYMAMEFLEGQDLFKHVQTKGRLEPDEAVQIIAPIASALDYIHRYNMIHRDVKSSNIFVTKSDRPVLTDFGIAHVVDGEQLTVSGTILGTPEYMSPEQAEGHPIDGRSDIYSLGVVLYHAITGRFPHRGDSPLTTIYKIINEQPVPVGKLAPVPEWLEAIVHQCMQKDPGMRIQTGSQLAELLSQHKIPSTKAPGIVVPRGSAIEHVQPKHLADPDRRSSQSPTREQSSPSASRMMYFLGALVVSGTAALSYLLWVQFQPQNGRIDSSPMPVSMSPKIQVNTSSVDSVRTSVIPNLMGRTLEEATVGLNEAHLRLGAVSKLASSLENKNKVYNQFPKPGIVVKQGEVVNVFVGE